MKAQENRTVRTNNTFTIFRYKIEDLEEQLHKQHEVIKNEVAIPLGKDLGTMQPNKPEPDCEKDVYSGMISGAYSKMMMDARQELQSEIETHHIISDKLEAELKLDELSKELEKTQTEARLKKRDLDACDNSLLKKEKRYKKIRWFLLFIILVDMFLSSAALMAMGYNAITSYIVGIAIGGSIFFASEQVPNMVNKGRNLWERRGVLFGIFAIAFGVFYVLGIFRATSFNEGVLSQTQGVNPFYFACLNLFFFAVSVITVYQHRLTSAERKVLDKWKLTKEELDELNTKVGSLKLEILTIRKEQAETELARKQILIYSNNIQELVQRLFEDSQKTFYSTNCIYRSDGKTPKFFEHDIPQLPSFNNTLKL